MELEVLCFRSELRVTKAAYSSEGEVAEQRAARGSDFQNEAFS
ncbi:MULTISPECIES: hypothetical protein [Paenibacillus]|nr:MULTISPECIES: hypothetical protein [Paenibacillus]